MSKQPYAQKAHKSNTIYLNKGQKPHDPHHEHRKKSLTKSNTIMIKYSMRRVFLQPDKGHLRTTHSLISHLMLKD